MGVGDGDMNDGEVGCWCLALRLIMGPGTDQRSLERRRDFWTRSTGLPFARWRVKVGSGRRMTKVSLDGALGGEGHCQ